LASSFQSLASQGEVSTAAVRHSVFFARHLGSSPATQLNSQSFPEQHFGGGALVRDFAAWIARGVETRGGERDGLFDGGAGVEAHGGEILIAIEKDGEATFCGGAECGGVQDVIGTFVHK